MLEVDVDLGDRPPQAGRVAAFALVSAVAEASTHVREVAPGVVEVITGLLPGDGSFATHGHVLRIRVVRGAEPDRERASGARGLS